MRVFIYCAIKVLLLLLLLLLLLMVLLPSALPAAKLPGARPGSPIALFPHIVLRKYAHRKGTTANREANRGGIQKQIPRFPAAARKCVLFMSLIQDSRDSRDSAGGSADPAHHARKPAPELCFSWPSVGASRGGEASAAATWRANGDFQRSR